MEEGSLGPTPKNSTTPKNSIFRHGSEARRKGDAVLAFTVFPPVDGCVVE